MKNDLKAKKLSKSISDCSISITRLLSLVSDLKEVLSKGKKRSTGSDQISVVFRTAELQLISQLLNYSTNVPGLLSENRKLAKRDVEAKKSLSQPLSRDGKTREMQALAALGLGVKTERQNYIKTIFNLYLLALRSKPQLRVGLKNTFQLDYMEKSARIEWTSSEKDFSIGEKFSRKRPPPADKKRSTLVALSCLFGYQSPAALRRALSDYAKKNKHKYKKPFPPGFF